MMSSNQGILLVNKPAGITSFRIVGALRRATGIQKIGHAGTLDPFATGVMVLLIGKQYTRLSDQFLHQDKAYRVTIQFGKATDSYDCDGEETGTSEREPTHTEIAQALSFFQGTILQTPPMFSAKKVGGKKLYELARQGIEIERKPVEITLTTELVAYNYPNLELSVACSKGTYIRSLAHDLASKLGICAHVSALTRTRSGKYLIAECVDFGQIADGTFRNHVRMSL